MNLKKRTGSSGYRTSLGALSTRTDYRTTQNAGSRDRSNVATEPSNPYMTRAGTIQTERGTNGPGGYRMDQDGNVEKSRNTLYAEGQDVIDRIKNHVQAILAQGYFREEDYDIRWNNILEAGKFGRRNEAEQLYNGVQLLKDSADPFMAGIDLSFLKENWEVVAAVGGLLLLVKFVKGKSSNEEPV